MELLKLELGILLVVLRKTVLDSLLQLVLDVSTHITYLDLGLLSNLVALLGQVATTLLGRHRDVQADHLTIVLGGDTYIRIHDGLLNVTDLLTVPRLDGNGTGIGHTDIGYLVEGHLTAV